MRPLLPLFALLVACTAETTDPVSADLTCTATVPDVPTLVDVRWEPASTAVRSWVEYTTADGVARTTADGVKDDDGAVNFTLFGATVEEDVVWTGISEEADGAQSTCAGTTHTGSLPSDMPTLAVTEDNGDWDPDVNYFLGTFYEMMGTRSHVFVIDRTGKYLWFVMTEDDTVCVDVHLPRDGEGLLMNQLYRDFELDAASIQRVSWHGDLVEDTPTTLAHHMFTELPDGTLAFQQLDAREFTDDDGVTDTWVGDAIAEVTPGGEAETVFSVWDWLTPEYNDNMDGISLYGGKDWTHGNLVSYDDETDRYLLSLAHVANVLEIERADMSVRRQFGPPGYTFASGTTPFNLQHTPILQDDGTILMFTTPSSGSNSGAIEYQIDDATQLLTETWSSPINEVSFCLGQALPMPSGHVLINSGCSGGLREVGKEDGLGRWQLTTPPGNGFGQVIPLAVPPWEL